MDADRRESHPRGRGDPADATGCVDALCRLLQGWAGAVEGRAPGRCVGATAGVAAATGDLPDDGGDRPRVIVTMSYDTLVDGIGHATLTATGEQVTPANVRALACDAGILPAVLGSVSQPLDVGGRTGQSRSRCGWR
ncbi:DUF222 domain-containing protein [Tessaracoccus sp. HDW20]|nr:DUF222 domain-containing protein [Tessaracoccus coleopterorum]